MSLGPDGPEAWSKAEQRNAALDQRRKDPKNTSLSTKIYQAGTLGDMFTTYRRTNLWRSDKKPRTREEWWECWKVIEPVFGDIPIKDINAIPMCDSFYSTLRANYSLHKAHKIYKIFRAMLNVAVAMKLIPSNPSLIRENHAPAGRSQTWEVETVDALACKAWEIGYLGLSIAIRVAYDTQFSPVDVRLLTVACYSEDEHGGYFQIERAKTGKKALGTITPETAACIGTYLKAMAVVIPKDQPFIRDRFGKIYKKDSLGDDFRIIRNILLPGDDRTLMDMRRTGAVEAVAGEATPSVLSAKSGNTIGQSSKLHDTYVPIKLSVVRRADEARKAGRKRLTRT
jgi:hypothetical protein